MPDGALRITGYAPLQQRSGEPMVMCIGPVGQSLPLHCPTTVPVTGLTWDEVSHYVRGDMTEGGAVLTGIFADGVLAVESVTEPDFDDGPEIEFPQLCADPSGTASGASDEWGPDKSAVGRIPGYQLAWVTFPETGPFAGHQVFNLAVTGDREQAAAVVRQSYDGLLCVGRVPGPTRAELSAARDRLEEIGEEVLIFGVGIGSLTDGHTGLEVQVFLATDEVRARVHEIVGAELVRWTSISGEFEIVG